MTLEKKTKCAFLKKQIQVWYIKNLGVAHRKKILGVTQKNWGVVHENKTKKLAVTYSCEIGLGVECMPWDVKVMSSNPGQDQD